MDGWIHPESIHTEIAFLSPIHPNPSTLDQSRIKLLYQNPVDSYANRLKIKALVLQPLQVTFYQCKWDLLNGVSCSLLNCGDPFLTAWFQFRLVGNLATHLSWVNFWCFHLVYCVENAMSTWMTSWRTLLFFGRMTMVADGCGYSNASTRKTRINHFTSNRLICCRCSFNLARHCSYWQSTSPIRRKAQRLIKVDCCMFHCSNRIIFGQIVAQLVGQRKIRVIPSSWWFL